MSNDQEPMTNEESQLCHWSLVIEHWSLIGIWDLDIGISLALCHLDFSGSGAGAGFNSIFDRCIMRQYLSPCVRPSKNARYGCPPRCSTNGCDPFGPAPSIIRLCSASSSLAML